MKKSNSLVALILIGNLLFGDVMELASPQLSASSAYYDSYKSSSIAISNPAITADIQRYTFDFNYLLLSDFNSNLGHSIDIGGVIPSKYGVFSGNVDLLLTDGLSNSDLYVGTAGNINLNFSKKIYSDLSFGAGLTTILGSDNNGFDWGLGLNLGFVKDMGNLNPTIKDFSWGVALKNLGKGYKNSDDFFNSPAPVFTPSIFARFRPVEINNLNVDVASELSFPTVSNVNLMVGAKASIYKNFIFDTSLDVNLQEMIKGDYGRIIPSMFFGYNLAIKGEETQLNLSANPYTNNLWAIGLGGTLPLGEKDTNPPEVKIDYSSVQYISPNFDGIKDELLLPLTVKDERYIDSYELVIKDSFGKTVKNILNKEERPENESFKNLYSKLITPLTGIPVPEAFRWDGKMDNGELVPDGEYTFYTRFSDDNGNTTQSEVNKFIVDNTNPELVITPPSGLDLIFSPNGDGNKDILTIPQTGSNEVRWYAEVSDFIGNPVKSMAWNNSELTSFEWDGKDDLGQLVPDGVYQYRVTSTDLAGNSVEDLVDNIIINTKQPPIGITISTNSFSPNKDGVKDNMEFILDIPVKTGIEKWDLVIQDSLGKEVNRFSTEKQGYSVIEDNIKFNGENSSGSFLTEGKYVGVLSVVYQNGHSPVVSSPEFYIDTTAPSANVIPAYTVFSPNGDGKKDLISFNQKSSNEEDWTGEIFDEFSKLVYTTNWKGVVDSTFNWDGKNKEGLILSDGEYNYKLSSIDSSGNKYKGEPISFKIDTTKSEINLSVNRESFSPLTNNSSVELKSEIKSSSNLVNYTLDIVDENNKTIKSLTTNGDINNLYSWNGTDNSGKRVKDAVYKGHITGEFNNGNIVNAYSTPFTLDTIKPVVTVKLKEVNNIFSPNGDGKKDSLTFIQKTSDEISWTGEVRNSVNEVVYSNTWSGIAPSEFILKGTNNSNTNLPDGTYTYSLSATDLAGNIGKSDNIEIKIDTEDVEFFISTNTTHFSPNKDKIKDSIDFIPQLKKADEIDSMIYTVLNNQNIEVYSKTVKSEYQKSVNWNGVGTNNKNVIDGEYIVRLTVNYKRGDSPVASTKFIVDTVAPKADVLLTNTVFSPNDDGNKDFVGIKNTSPDIALWNLSITDSKGNIIKEEIINGKLADNWDFNGRDKGLNLLPNGNYKFILKGEDEAGNIYKSPENNIILDNSSSNIFISNNYEVFSPNGDGIKDKITFTTKFDSASGIEKWSLNILDSNGKIVKSYNEGKIPGEIVWDGKPDLKDGTYKAVLNILNINGNNPIAYTPEFKIDSTYPSIILTAQNTLFSPNGDNLKDNVLFNQSGLGEDIYYGRIIDSNNNIVNEWFWKNSLNSFNWDGKDKSGNIVSDGTYSYIVDVTDAGGNKTVKTINNLVIDTTETDIFITYKKPIFAPDLVSSLGPQTFGLIVNNKKGIESWSISISDERNVVVDTIRGQNTVPETTTWSGKDSSGKFVNGNFKANFNVVYEKGNSPQYSTKYFIADSENPLINVETSPTPFSPDNDFVDDELNIDLGVKDFSDIDNWAFVISDPKGNEFITFSGEGKPGKKIIWDGKSSKGELVQAAEEYKYVMSVTDKAGHVGKVSGEIPVDILVIKEGDKLKIKISSIIFQPNSSELDLSGKNGESNRKILKRLSEILNKYSSYKIEVEGHAHNIYGNEITKNQRISLIEFSQQRAEEVKKALSLEGIAKSRMTTIGVGGNKPIVDFSDYDNIWKNRRVEFILVK